jgi:probable rRNA maturation factor
MAVYINNQTRARISLAPIKQLAEAFLKKYQLADKELSIAFVTSRAMARINHRYRKINKTTDVLSFGGEGEFFGEILIDYRIIKKQAKDYRRTKEEELDFILIHGLFHLFGYDDETEKQRQQMISLGEEFLRDYKE